MHDLIRQSTARGDFETIPRSGFCWNLACPFRLQLLGERSDGTTCLAPPHSTLMVVTAAEVIVPNVMVTGALPAAVPLGIVTFT